MVSNLSALSTLTLCSPDLSSDRVESAKYSLSQPCPCVKKHLVGQESTLQSNEQSVSAHQIREVRTVLKVEAYSLVVIGVRQSSLCPAL